MRWSTHLQLSDWYKDQREESTKWTGTLFWMFLPLPSPENQSDKSWGWTYWNLPPCGHCKVMDFEMYCMNFKGDWKYIWQLFSLSRYATKEQAGVSQNCVGQNLFEKYLVSCHGMFSFNPLWGLLEMRSDKGDGRCDHVLHQHWPNSSVAWHYLWWKHSMAWTAITEQTPGFWFEDDRPRHSSYLPSRCGPRFGWQFDSCSRTATFLAWKQSWSAVGIRNGLIEIIRASVSIASSIETLDETEPKLEVKWVSRNSLQGIWHICPSQISGIGDGSGWAGRSSISSSNPGLGIEQCVWVTCKRRYVFDASSTRPSENRWKSFDPHIPGMCNCSARSRRSPMENQTKISPFASPLPGDGQTFRIQFSLSQHMDRWRWYQKMDELEKKRILFERRREP